MSNSRKRWHNPATVAKGRRRLQTARQLATVDAALLHTGTGVAQARRQLSLALAAKRELGRAVLGLSPENFGEMLTDVEGFRPWVEQAEYDELVQVRTDLWRYLDRHFAEAG